MKKIYLLFLFLFFQKTYSSQYNRTLGDPNYGTPLVPLITAVTHTDGPILELGSGDFSTPILHALCSGKKRLIVTTDTDKAWLSLFDDLETEWHKFVYVPVYNDFGVASSPHNWNDIGNDYHWSVVLVDHRPGERRRVDIQRLRNNTDIFVIHDTQEPSYEWSILLTFKYSYTYTRYNTYTTIISDTIDVRKMFES